MSLEMTGQEAIHIVSAEKVGNYDVECQDVPMPEDFYSTEQFSR